MSNFSERAINDMTPHELLERAEWYAQDIERRGIVDSDIVASWRIRSESDAKLWISHNQGKNYLLRYVMYFAGCVRVLWKKHLTNVMSSPDWYTKVTVFLDEHNNIKLLDPTGDELDAIYHDCDKRLYNDEEPEFFVTTRNHDEQD